MDAVLTPTEGARDVAAPARIALTIDGGTVAAGRTRTSCATVSASRCRICAAPVRDRFADMRRRRAALDVSIARATIGPRGASSGSQAEARSRAGSACRRPSALDRARVRWPAPAPWTVEFAAAASFPSGARSEVDLQLPARQRRDSPADVQGPGQRRAHRVRLAAGTRGRAFPRFRIGTLDRPNPRDADRRVRHAARRFRGHGRLSPSPSRSRATGKLEGTSVELARRCSTCPLVDRSRSRSKPDGERVRMQDTVLRLADEPLSIAGSITPRGDGFVVDGNIARRAASTRSAGSTGCARTPRPRSDASPWRWPLRGRDCRARQACRCARLPPGALCRHPWCSTNASSRRRSPKRACAASRCRSRGGDGSKLSTSRAVPRAQDARRGGDRVSFEGLASAPRERWTSAPISRRAEHRRRC